MKLDKILFLDFDGVLNSKKGFIADKPKHVCYFTLECCKNLNTVLDSISELKIVVSSAWRLHFSLTKIKSVFKKYGLPKERIIGVTPGMNHFSNDDQGRQDQIRSWIKTNKFSGLYVVVDDTQSDLQEIKDHCVFTTFEDGLSIDKANEIINLFYLQEPLMKNEH